MAFVPRFFFRIFTLSHLSRACAFVFVCTSVFVWLCLRAWCVHVCAFVSMNVQIYLQQEWILFQRNDAAGHGPHYRALEQRNAVGQAYGSALAAPNQDSPLQ